MKPYYFFIHLCGTITLSCLYFSSFSQSDKRCIYVLKKQLEGKEYVFGHSKNNDNDEKRLTYLGILKSDNGVEYKVLNYCWIWGQAKRATNRILIYSKKNHYLGNYYLTMTGELPSSIAYNRLIFKTISDSTKHVVITKISFKKGVPPTIYLLDDDIFSFEKAD